MKQLLMLSLIVLAGCATPQKLQIYEPTAPVKDKATVYIYRSPTSVDSLNPDIPRFFLNETSHGKLTIGGHYVSIVNPV